MEKRGRTRKSAGKHGKARENLEKRWKTWKEQEDMEKRGKTWKSAGKHRKALENME